MKATKAKSRHKCEIVSGQRISCWWNKDCWDCWTVVFLDTQDERHTVGFRGMSDHPCHPQGYGQWGEMALCHVGYKGRGGCFDKRVKFADLPEECQKLVLSDIKDLNDMNGGEK